MVVTKDTAAPEAPADTDTTGISAGESHARRPRPIGVVPTASLITGGALAVVWFWIPLGIVVLGISSIPSIIGFVVAAVVFIYLMRGIDWVERGEGVMIDDILAAEERCGFKVEEGDVLLIRTGQLHRRNVEGPVDRSAGTTACQASVLPLFYERGIAMMGSDTGNDVNPPQYEKVPSPIHQVSITAMGIWILDNADLEGVAQACKERNRWEFMISIGPLRLHNTTGSPVNPIAIF